MPDEMGETVKFYDVLEKASVHSGMSYRTISSKLGRVPNYIAVMRNKGRIPSVDNAAALLDVCGYALCAIPENEIPENALRITSDTDTQ